MRAAILAASPHNTQPWLFKVTDSWIELYMDTQRNVGALDPYLNSVQWSRRFMGLKLFLALAAAGWQGYAAHVERAVAVIARVKAQLIARGWTAVNDSQLAVLCVVPPPGYPEVREVVRRVLASGRAWVAATQFAGHDVVRICATHGEIAAADVDELVAALDATV